MQNLVWIGKIIQLEPAANSDNLDAVNVVCGKGGKWRGVVKRGEFQIGDLCQVYLQDSIVPDTPEFEFMRSKKFKVRMCLFRGNVSEVLITKQTVEGNLGDDVTCLAKVTKYEKPLDAKIGGDIAGPFPGFIPKTDEINFQSAPELLEALAGKPYYITVKFDGSSGTIWKKNGKIGVASRNYELKDTPNCLGWHLVRKYKLDELLPDQMAIQFEMYGPGIQSNPMKTSDKDMAVFNVWDMNKCSYLDWLDAEKVCQRLNLPFVTVVSSGEDFPVNPLPDWLQRRADLAYPCGSPAEGIVVRPQKEMRIPTGERVSFKVINLKYKN